MTQLQITDNRDELAAQLSGLRGLIVFDGCPGTGKETLARAMAERLKCHRIYGDDHIEKGRDSYVPALRLNELRADIDAGAAVAPITILHCNCAREVISRLGQSAAAFVYVEPVSPAGLAGNSDMQRAEEEGAPFDRPYFSGLDREVMAYHAQYKPIGSADILYRWTEN